MVQGRISRGGQFEVEAANLEVGEGDIGARYQLRSRIEWLEAKEQQAQEVADQW